MPAKTLMKLTTGVNFINVLQAAFTCADFEISKKDSQLFSLLCIGICQSKSCSKIVGEIDCRSVAPTNTTSAITNGKNSSVSTNETITNGNKSIPINETNEKKGLLREIKGTENLNEPDSKRVIKQRQGEICEKVDGIVVRGDSNKIFLAYFELHGLCRDVLTFTNMFMQSFYTCRSQKRKKTVTLSMSFCAFGICNH